MFVVMLVGPIMSGKIENRLKKSFNTTDGRPEKSKRKFASEAVDTFIEKTKPKFKDSNLAVIYQNCFPNTLDTTVEYDSTKDDTFVITGDIEAMWLRDSSFQVFPYIKFAKTDLKLRRMLLAMIKRQSKSILIDPYANAFNKNEFNSPWQNDITYKMVNGQKIKAMNTKLWERKYELDSIISPLFFAYNFYEQTKETSFITNSEWQAALATIISVVKKEMRGSEEEDLNGGPEYFFQRTANEPFDSLHQGRGNPAGSCGLVKSMFRNSDDAATFAYSIPENAFLVATFKKVASMLKTFLTTNKIDEIQYKKYLLLINDLEAISSSVQTAIYKNGVFKDPETNERYFAYEVDCYGNHYFLDDPGYPSLTALPFFGFIDKEDALYISTRKRILSKKNPYYFQGLIGDGLGSAHSERYYIWPLFSIMRALTSSNEAEILEAVKLLQYTAAETGFMHESVNVNDTTKFTRPWFAWTNSFFGYMINTINEERPHLLLK